MAGFEQVVDVLLAYSERCLLMVADLYNKGVFFFSNPVV